MAEAGKGLYFSQDDFEDAGLPGVYAAEVLLLGVIEVEANVEDVAFDTNPDDPPEVEAEMDLARSTFLTLDDLARFIIALRKTESIFTEQCILEGDAPAGECVLLLGVVLRDGCSAANALSLKLPDKLSDGDTEESTALLPEIGSTTTEEPLSLTADPRPQVTDLDIPPAFETLASEYWYSVYGTSI